MDSQEYATEGAIKRAVSYGDLILIEDDVVGETNVVDPVNALSGLDGHVGGLEHQGTTVSSQLHSGSVGAEGKAHSGDAEASSLGHPVNGNLTSGR